MIGRISLLADWFSVLHLCFFKFFLSSWSLWSSVFLFSLLAVGQLVGGGRHGGGRRRVLEAQRAADGRRQNDAQDDAADDDHDFLLRDTHTHTKEDQDKRVAGESPVLRVTVLQPF